MGYRPGGLCRAAAPPSLPELFNDPADYRAYIETLVSAGAHQGC